AGSPFALMATALTCPCRRSMTWASSGRPSSMASGLSPPPIRVERPPAKIIPAIECFIARLGQIRRRLYAVRGHVGSRAFGDRAPPANHAFAIKCVEARGHDDGRSHNHCRVREVAEDHDA